VVGDQIVRVRGVVGEGFDVIVAAVSRRTPWTR
jgi:hypothetical protein